MRLGADVVVAVVQPFNTSTNCILTAISLNVFEHECDCYIKFIHAVYYSPAVENVDSGTMVELNPSPEPAARVRVEDIPDSGFGNVHLATVFRHAISPTEN